MAAASDSVLADSREFVLTRELSAPRALVFRAWTEPKGLAHWFGPRTFTTRVTELDLRPGGAWRVVMRSPEGHEYPLRGVYLEVVPPERLVYTDDWSEHPPEWHAELKRAVGEPLPKGSLTTVTFDDLGDRTRVTLRVRFASQAVRDAMARMGMDEVWPDSLARLEAAAQTL